MKRIFLALALLPALPLPALAGEKSVSVPAVAVDGRGAHRHGSPPVTIGSGGTDVVADDTTGTIRFLIDGEEKAFLDADGFHISGDLFVGGSSVDDGPSGFDNALKGRLNNKRSKEGTSAQ
jgi:hypothetical protein